MRPCFLLAVALSCLLVVGCDRTDPKLSFSAHSQATIPASAKLVHSGAQVAGLDASYGFVFDVTDDQLQDQLIDEWELKASPPTAGTFFQFAKHDWWPTNDALLKMEESFGRSDDQKEEYWHVWRDRLHGKLFIEHGRW